MRKKKIKNIIISGLLILMITVNSYQYAYASSLAATVALGDSLATAGAGGTVGALLAPEVIIPMALVALGIAGIGFVANSSIVQDIAQDIRDNHSEWCVLQGGAGGDDPNNRRPFLKGWFRAGKVFVSEGLLAIIARYAVDHGLFNGVNTNYNYSYDESFNNNANGANVEITGVGNLTDAFGFIAQKIDELKSANYNDIHLLYDKVAVAYAYVNSNYGSTDNSYGTVYVSSGQTLVSVSYLTNITFPITGTIGNGYSSGQGVNRRIYLNNSYHYYNVDLRIDNDGSITEVNTSDNTSNEIWYGCRYFLGNNYITSVRSFPVGLLKNGDVTGIPVTNNIPEIDNDEVILPDWDYDGIKVPKVLPDGVPDPAALEDALPVSVPDGYEVPMIYPDDWPDALPELAPAPQPYPWPNLPHNPANPDPDAQPEAQEGGGAAIPSIDNPNGDATFNSFLVPENIKEKYPFCIPFDMYDIYHILFYGSNPDSAHTKTSQLISANSIQAVNMARAAPHYEIDYSSIRGFENAAPIVIDLSRFDDTAEIFRLAILTLWGADLIFSGFSAASGGKN